jgi:hypothetical protein
MSRYTFLIDLGQSSRTVTYSGDSEQDAREIALSSLTDADKGRVCNVALVSVLASEES